MFSDRALYKSWQHKMANPATPYVSYQLQIPAARTLRAISSLFMSNMRPCIIIYYTSTPQILSSNRCSKVTLTAISYLPTCSTRDLMPLSTTPVHYITPQLLFTNRCGKGTLTAISSFPSSSTRDYIVIHHTIALYRPLSCYPVSTLIKLQEKNATLHHPWSTEETSHMFNMFICLAHPQLLPLRNLASLTLWTMSAKLKP